MAQDITLKHVYPRIKEPSGIVYHAQSKSIFLAGDRGNIIQISIDGKSSNAAVHEGAGYEGLTCSTDGNYLYAAIERDKNHDDVIAEIRASNLQRTGRRIRIKWPSELLNWFQKKGKKRGKDGIEGLTSIPDRTNPTNSSTSRQTVNFWIARQRDPAAIYKLQATFMSGSAQTVDGFITESYQLVKKKKKKKKATVVPGFLRTGDDVIVDLAGLQYEEIPGTNKGTLYVLSDKNNRLYKLDVKPGTIAPGTTAYKLPKEVGGKPFAQEGITMDASDMYFANDEGGVFSIPRSALLDED